MTMDARTWSLCVELDLGVSPPVVKTVDVMVLNGNPAYKPHVCYRPSSASSQGHGPRAEPAKLLFETLSACRAEAQQRHFAPLMSEVSKLLRLLFPGGSVRFDDALGELSLDRGSSIGKYEFGDLSAGAREQLGVLVRLALARLVAGSEALPVLLDDALVATDEHRFERMSRVLAAAAEELQIIVLTCHWDRLRGLGLSPDHRVDLEELVLGG